MPGVLLQWTQFPQFGSRWTTQICLACPSCSPVYGHSRQVEQSWTCHPENAKRRYLRTSIYSSTARLSRPPPSRSMMLSLGVDNINLAPKLKKSTTQPPPRKLSPPGPKSPLPPSSPGWCWNPPISGSAKEITKWLEEDPSSGNRGFHSCSWSSRALPAALIKAVTKLVFSRWIPSHGHVGALLFENIDRPKADWVERGSSVSIPFVFDSL